jgi:LemA protein
VNPLWLFLAPVVAIPAWGAWTFNRLVIVRNQLKEAWSGIDVQLKRRHDLVPRLVSCVEAYRDHDRTLLESVAQARAIAAGGLNVQAAGLAENRLSLGLRDLLVVAEAYPTLKADENFRQLSTQLTEIEEQLQFARRYFNGGVRDLNNLVESFPSLLVARALGFRTAEFFALDSAVERTVPEVRL